MKNRKLISSSPNFTIVLPVQCNADCKFCSWRTSAQHKQDFSEDFLTSLKNTLENLPKDCTQLTISGGEPSLYKDLESVMTIIAYHKLNNIEKVVFTTNGQNLEELSKMSWFTNSVDYVNLSRHSAVQDTNNAIFGTDTIEWSSIKTISEILGNQGIPLNINCVLSTTHNEELGGFFVNDFVNKCKDNYVSTLTFRKDYNDGFGVHDLETLVSIKHKAKSIGECPVCRKSRYIIKGLEVIFTTSEFEPKDIVGNDIYEYILQPNGDLTSDWEGKIKINLDNQGIVYRAHDHTLYEVYGCNFSGCL